jgi:succinate dehydrogenase / fumarate reductase, flavoprotein subunit
VRTAAGSGIVIPNCCASKASYFPKRNDENWLKHTLAWRDADGVVRLDYRPVHLQPLSNEVSSIPSKERVY